MPNPNSKLPISLSLISLLSTSSHCQSIYSPGVLQHVLEHFAFETGRVLHNTDACDDFGEAGYFCQSVIPYTARGRCRGIDDENWNLRCLGGAMWKEGRYIYLPSSHRNPWLPRNHLCTVSESASSSSSYVHSEKEGMIPANSLDLPNREVTLSSYSSLAHSLICTEKGWA